MQGSRIQEKRRRGDCLEAWTGRKVEITVDRLLRARWKMMKNKANGPRDCLTEMLQERPMESVFETTRWFEKRFRGDRRAPAARQIQRLVFLKQHDAKLEKGNLRVSGSCSDVRIGEMVCGCGGRTVARRTGAD